MTPILGTGGATRGVATPPPAPAPAGLARTVRRGEALFDVGSPADSLYRIESGLVALTLPLRSGRTRILSLAGPGEYVGALAPGMRDHAERAEALSPTVTAVAYWREHVDRLLEPALFDALHRHATRLRRSLEDADRPVAARVALALLDLGERYGHVAEDGATRLTLPLTHEHLAAMVGAARETTSGAVADLRAAGVLSGTRGRYRFVAERLRDALPLLDLRD